MRNFKSKLLLKIFDFRIGNSERLFFLKRFLLFSVKGISYSILIIGGLTLVDILLIKFYTFLNSYYDQSLACKISESSIVIYSIFGIKKVDYLIEVINVSAGILGVLLGLFYTAFLTIISTKYSNINSTIGTLLLEQKSLNKYFVLLATLTSFSIIFELLLSTGYSPTLFSSVIFIYFIISALIGFISYGKFSLIYFDTSTLVYDLIERNNILLYRIRKHAKSLSRLKRGESQLLGLYRNLKKIKTIVVESKKPEVSNTSYDVILSSVLKFSTYYNRVKYLIPSKDGWHIKVNKPKRWENAKEWDFNLLRSAGVDIMPESIQSYNLIELNLIDIQFEIMDHLVQGQEQLDSLVKQEEMVHSISYQLDFEGFTSYFLSLEKLVLDKLNVKEDIAFNLQVTHIYSYLLIQYLVAFNANLERYSVNELSKLATAISKDRKYQKPYFIRIWEDKFKDKLEIERFIEGKKVTPLIFLKFELVEHIQYELQGHYKKVSGFIHDKISGLINELKKEGFLKEALQLSISAIELRKKMSLFLENTKNTIDSYEKFDFKLWDEKFYFSKYEVFQRENRSLQEFLIRTIWEVGPSSYDIKEKNLSDLYGNYYHLILDDITEKTLNKDTSISTLTTLLEKYNVACILYLESLRVRYKDSENIEYVASKLYPFIIDLFEINSLVIIRGIALQQSNLISNLFDFWDKIVDKITKDEVTFWKYNLAIYRMFKQSIYGLSTSSYSKEFDRKRKLEDFLKNEGIIRKERVKGGMLAIVEEYITDIDDYYLQAIAKSMHIDSMSFFDINELFVEYYLRTRVSLKELEIEETRYGEQIRWIVGRTFK